MTDRTAEGGRLFPTIDLGGGWSMSAQADAVGYACRPKERLNRLEDYDAVEVVLYGPFPYDVDPRTMELPDAVLEKFGRIEDGAPCLGLFLTKDDIAAVKHAVMKACSSPNAGIPRGVHIWPGQDVFHGTDVASAQDIVSFGPVIERSAGGYFGGAFYVAEEEALARSNYADFSGDEGGVVAFTLSETARILDLRNGEDWKVWKEVTSGLDMGSREFAAHCRHGGVDGIYDRSFGGLAIFNPKVLVDARLTKTLKGVIPAP